MAVRLQKPQIIDIVGSTIKIKHPDLSVYLKKHLAEKLEVSETDILLKDNRGLAEDDMILLGSPGAASSEVVQITSAVTPGQTVVTAGNHIYSHTTDSVVYRIFERQIKIYGLASPTDAPTLIDTVDISWDQPFTSYTETTGLYAYIQVAFSDGTTESALSEPVPTAGLPDNTVTRIIDRALAITSSGIDDKITYDLLLEALNTAQQYYANYVNNREVRHNWSFEEQTDGNSLTGLALENRYSLEGLDFKLKYPNSLQGILEIWIGTQPVKLGDLQFVKQFYRGVQSAKVAAAISPGDTTVTVDTTVDFPDAGTVRIGNDVITYTGKTAITFTGIPTTGEGSIANPYLEGRTIWGDLQNTQPRYATIDKNEILLDAPLPERLDGKRIRVSAYAKMPTLYSLTQEVTVPFLGTLVKYLSYVIYMTKENVGIANECKLSFEQMIAQESKGDKSHVPDSYSYQEMNGSDPVNYYLGNHHANQRL